jgi:hypothetical protein
VGVIADVQTAVNPGLFQKNINVVKAWATIVNSHGGLAGRQVVVDSCDSKLDPNATRNCVINLCSKDFALVGSAALALTDVTDLNACKNSTGDAIGIPDLAGIVFTRALQCNPNTFAQSGNNPTLCQTLNDNPQTYTVPIGDAKYLTSQYPGLHGVFLYNSDTPTAKASQVPTYTADSQFGGIKFDGQGTYGSSAVAPQSALTPVVNVMKQNGSTFGASGSTPANFEQLESEAKLQGVTTVKAWECDGGCYAPYFIALDPSVTEGTYQNLTTIAFYTEYQDNPALAAEVQQLGGINNLDSNSLSSFVESLLFQDAVNKAIAHGGTLNRESLFNVLRTQETAFNADGITGTTDVSHHQLSPCFAIARVISGKWQRVYPAKAESFDCNPSNVVQIKLNEK